ncbi:MAG TPA: twin-arginine translocase TatA/TatE family subunit [Ktedonobacteraceae bacterium]|jgi:Sec-independent protein translocase protein TatA|nr:twin-arginine translocase TatA/TatE family subunit [Ktedonobacteraceae bacterium]HLI69758.1 twin-arginine translocase TatA/TatE family subunit [Ktedonobacteraceae bacterium]
MGGFHPLDIIVIVGIALLLFGPKTLQSISHSMGRGVGHAKEMKDKLMTELPVEDLAKVNRTISQIPTSPQQAAKRLIASSILPGEQESAAKAAKETIEEPAREQE